MNVKPTSCAEDVVVTIRSVVRPAGEGREVQRVIRRSVRNDRGFSQHRVYLIAAADAALTVAAR